MTSVFEPTDATRAEWGPRPAAEFGFDPDVCAGVFVGGCVRRGVESSFRRKAHAHCGVDDKHRGWICVRSHRRLWTTGQTRTPTRLMFHEYAHQLCPPNTGHGPLWRAVMRALGYPNDAANAKRSATPDRPVTFSPELAARIDDLLARWPRRPRDERAFYG